MIDASPLSKTMIPPLNRTMTYHTGSMGEQRLQWNSPITEIIVHNVELPHVFFMYFTHTHQSGMPVVVMSLSFHVGVSLYHHVFVLFSEGIVVLFSRDSVVL